MLKPFVIFGICAALVLGVCAQEPPATSQSASIAGTVEDAISGQPLKGANVGARSFQPGQGGRHFSSASSDAQGHFLLEGLVPGRYFVSASREDYVGSRSRGNRGAKLLTIAPDQHINDVILQLMPGAVLSGHVKNAAGEPVGAASVEVLKYFYDGGQKQLHGVRAASMTNPAGEYRITGLSPDHYYLRAAAVSGENAKSRVREAYAPAYYPGNSDLTRAVELTVRPGEDVSGIDLTLNLVHTVDVEGRVVMMTTAGSAPAANAEVNLVDAEAGSTSLKESASDGKGHFVLHDVLPGNYVLLAQMEASHLKKNKVLFGSEPVHVSNASLRKVQVMIGPGADVSGRIHLDEKSDNAIDEKNKVDLTRISVELEAAGSSSVTALMPAVESVQLAADGSFLIADVPEGSYALNFYPLPAGYYLKSGAALDVLETGLIVAHGQTLPPLDLTLSSRVARLEGDVSATGEPAAGASVVLVPESNRIAPTRNLRQSVTDRSGRFSVKNIIPGDYKVFAFEDVERGAFLNPDFLRPFEERSQSVHFDEGGSINVRLDAIPASETAP